MLLSQTPLCFLWMENAFELCRYYNICIKRNSLQVCECQENLLKQILIWFIAEEHIKLSEWLNTITIIHCLTKANLKSLISIPIFGSLIKGKIRRLYYKVFSITIYFIRPNENVSVITKESTFPTYSHWQVIWMLYCLSVISSTLHSRLLYVHHYFLVCSILYKMKSAWQLIWLYVSILVEETNMNLENGSQNANTKMFSQSTPTEKYLRCRNTTHNWRI